MISKIRSSFLTAGLFAVLAGQGIAGTVVVTPSNMDGWATMVTDDSGSQASSNPTAGTVFVNGLATPPAGVGSLNLFTGDGTTGGDGSAQVRNSGYDGVLVSSLTALSYSTYVTSNNGQQAPYLTIWINTSAGTDRLWFEPPYAGSVALNQWQTWDALHATSGWYDDNGTGGSAPGTDTTKSLADLLSLLPGATIYNPAGAISTLGGIRIAAGFASPADVFNTYVDNVTIGGTTYDFEASAAVPEPSALFAGATGVVCGLGVWLRRRRPAA